MPTWHGQTPTSHPNHAYHVRIDARVAARYRRGVSGIGVELRWSGPADCLPAIPASDQQSEPQYRLEKVLRLICPEKLRVSMSVEEQMTLLAAYATAIWGRFG